MSAERFHRFMMAAVIGLGTGLIQSGIAEGFYVLYFVIGMLVVYGLTNFCPAITILKKLGLKSDIKLHTERIRTF